MILNFTICVLFTARVMKHFYDRDQQREEPKAGVQAVAYEPEAQKPVQKSGNAIEALRTMLVGSVILGCELHPVLASFYPRQHHLTLHRLASDPLIILPIYRSSITTDWTRLVITCFVHPLVQELALSFQRIAPSLSRDNYQLVLKCKSYTSA